MAIINIIDANASNIQKGIISGNNGDTIFIPSGFATWDNTGIIIPSSKYLTIDGGGVTILRGSGSSVMVSLTTNTGGSTRITNFNFISQSGAAANDILSIGGGFDNPKFRIDHCTFSGRLPTSTPIEISLAWGLIDHCTFCFGQASEMIHNLGWGTNNGGNTTGNSGWNQTIVPGGPDALYIEDCVFSNEQLNDQYFYGCSALQSYYGARTVLRHCTLNYCQIDQHGTPGNVGARWFEFYNLNFIVPPTGNQSNAFAIRAGAGVVFNTSGSGGVATPNFELQEEDAGSYPELWQVGRGKNIIFPPVSGGDQSLDPLYCWNNYKQPNSSSPTYIQQGRDYYTGTQRSGYTSYTYPYPWDIVRNVSMKRIPRYLKLHSLSF